MQLQGAAPFLKLLRVFLSAKPTIITTGERARRNNPARLWLNVSAPNLVPLEFLPNCQAILGFVVFNHIGLLWLPTKVVTFAFNHVYLIIYKPKPLFLDVVYVFFQVFFNLIPDHFVYLSIRWLFDNRFRNTRT